MTDSRPPDPIEAYVGTLRARLGWRRDVDDIVDEVADHLWERAEILVARGDSPVDAQRRTLAAFGDLGLVVRSFAQSDAGAPAVPTTATRVAGLAALAGALAWVASIVAALAGGHMSLLTAWTLPRYQTWVALVVLAHVLTTIALAGVLLRIGRLRTTAGLAALAVGVLILVGLLVVGWTVTLVTGVFGVAVLAAVRRAGPNGDTFVRPVRLLAVWVLGGAALVLFDEVIPVGPVDEYGDHMLAWVVPFLACALCSAAALAVTGARLLAERPVDLGPGPGHPILTAAG